LVGVTVLLVVAAVLAVAAFAQAVRIGVVRHDWMAIELLVLVGGGIAVLLLLGSAVFNGGE
jgi:hypothetical protein